MPTINQLSPVDTLQGGDNFPVYDTSNGDARKVSANVLLQYFQSTFANPQYEVSYSTPTGSGFVILLPTSSSSQWMICSPTGPFAAGTFTMPASPFDGKEVILTVTESLTALTINGNGATVAGAPGGLDGDSTLRFRYNETNDTWYLISAVYVNEPAAPGVFTTLTSSSTTVLNGTTIPASVTLVSENATQTLTNKTLTSPTLTTPALGTPSSGVLTSCTGLPIATGVSGLGANVATFLATPSSANLAAALTDETGTGAAVFADTPTLVTPILGTPTSGDLTNCTNLPVSTGISGLGTGIASALAINTGSAGAPVLFDGALGTPSSGDLTNCTSLPLSTGVSGALPVANGGTGASAAVQNLSGPGAVDVTSLTTAFTSTGTGDALTLADGTAGQIKNVVYVAETAGADTGILTPSNFGNGSDITFNAVGDSCQLQFIGTDWWVISVNGAVVA